MRPRLHGALLVMWAVLAASALPAEARLWMSASGSKAYLTGDIDNGDDARFEAFLNQPRAVKLKTVYLSSPGGYIAPAIRISQMIRKAGLATAVEADRVRCDSACNMIFAGGVRRYYVRGDRVSEGYSSVYGLGYHPSHVTNSARTYAVLSDRGTDTMAAFYRSMGQPRAIELARKAAFNSFYRPNGQTALQLKIATSLAEPPD
jgi:hypothetical protein